MLDLAFQIVLATAALIREEHQSQGLVNTSRRDILPLDCAAQGEGECSWLEGRPG